MQVTRPESPYSPENVKLLDRLHVLAVIAQADYKLHYEVQKGEWSVHIHSLALFTVGNREIARSLDCAIEFLEWFMTEHNVEFPKADEEDPDLWKKFYQQRVDRDVEIFKAIVGRGGTHTRIAKQFDVDWKEPGAVIDRIMYAIHQELENKVFKDAPYCANSNGVYDTHLHNLRRHKDFLLTVLSMMEEGKLANYLIGFYKQKK